MATPGNLLFENYDGGYIFTNSGFRTAKPVEIDNDLTVTGSINGTLVSTSLSTTGGLSVKTGTAAPASAGAVAAGAPIQMFSNGISIWVTSDAPAFTATKGDLCIALNGSSSSTRLFINNGTTNWVAITTAS